MELKGQISAIISALILWSVSINAQNNIRENVYLHLSSPELVVGETLYFSSFVFSEQTGKLSSLSSIVYIEVLDQENKSIYNGQISITDGLGSGQIYLSTELETGNYNIVAYTKWMKNFNEMFEQVFTVINPYRKYTNPEDSLLQTKVNFYPESGYVLNGVKNRIILRITDQYNRWISSNGRIIDGSGNTLIRFDTTTRDYLKFTYIPEINESYQLILENDSDFKFYKLPSACQNCSRIYLKDIAGQLTINLKSNFLKETKHELIISNKQGIIKQLLVLQNSESVLGKTELPKGMLKIDLLINGDNFSERMYWNGDLPFHKKYQKVQEYDPLDSINATFELAKPAKVSISVAEVDDSQSFIKDISLNNLIDSQLSEPLPQSLGLTNVEALNDILIMSQSKTIYENQDSIRFLPDYKFGIIQGRVMTNDENNEPLQNELVGLSLLGTSENLSVTRSDSLGNFVLSYDYKQESLKSIRALNLPIEEYKISVSPSFYQQYPKFMNPPLKLDSGKLKSIIERSVHNQIQNAYYDSRVDSTGAIYGHIISGSQSYKLNDYTRFQTMRDTFIEIIENVSVSKNESKFDFNIHLAGIDFGDKNPHPSLILLNGLFSNAKEILELSPYNVEQIDVLNRRYYFGDMYFDGIISVHSVKQNLENIRGSDYSYKAIESLDNEKDVILDLSSKRIPHYEHLLLWKPEVIQNGGKLNLTFPCSEVIGLFEIRIQGIAEDGSLISKKKYFRIK